MSALPDYEDHDATALADLVARGEVHPRELVDAAIARIEAVDPRLNAVVHRSFARALSEAADDAATLPDGPFRGVPFLLKDLRAHDAGQPATYGSRLYRELRPTQDDELVRRFKSTGVVVLGRSNSPELGILGVTEPTLHGPTRNPWNTEHTPGGSSGGAGAAVAARMVPIAHASDGGGSIRIPAANCGLVGLKPSRHRLPLAPLSGTWGGLAVHHVVCRSVRDSAAMLDAIHGPVAGVADRLPAPDRPFADQARSPREGLRIAICKQALLAGTNAPACVEAVDRAAAACESLGHEVEEATPAIDRAALRRAYLILVACGTAAALDAKERELGRPARLDELEAKTWLMRRVGEAVTGPEYLAQFAVIHEAVEVMARFFATHDVLVTPTLARPPMRIGEIHDTAFERWAAALLHRVRPPRRLIMSMLDRQTEAPLAPNPNTQLFNLTGQPAISLPLHWDRGLPIGVQFAGRVADEGLLLGLAGQLEQVLPWVDRRPSD